MGNIFRRVRRILGIAALVIGSVAAHAAEPPPLAAYGRLPDIEMMALSDDGTRVAAVMTLQGERMLAIVTSDLAPLRARKLEETKVRSIEWIGNDRVLMMVSRTERLQAGFVGSDQYETTHAFVIPADPAVPEFMVFDNDPTVVNAIFGSYGVRTVGGRPKVFVAGRELERQARGYTWSNRGPALFAIDPVTGKRDQVADPGSQGMSHNWLLGPNGAIAATFDIDMLRGRWHIKAPGGVVLAEGTSKLGDVGLVALGRDGRTVIYSQRNAQDDPTVLFEVPLDGSKKPLEFAKFDDIERTFIDRTNGQLLAVVKRGVHDRPDFYASTHQAVMSKIYRAFPGFEVDLVDWTADFARVLVRTTGQRDSGTWYLVDLSKMGAKALGYEREAIGPEHVGEVSMVSYKARDGLDVDGVLTLPPGREAKNLPVVMLPHGGPHAHDEPVFDWWAQAFASRGYAVFQPNFRGSTNRDEAFMRAGFGQWGKSMQSDITDGLGALAERGIVDPKRACIVGASYGGYAALAGVTLEQGVYRCAVAVAPVTDLSLLFSGELNDSGRLRMFKRSLLEELGPRDGFDAVSPRRSAAKADAPILLIHGKDDSVVPFEQSAKMADALEDAGKPHKLVVLRQEDHWLSRADTRLQMLEEAVAFVQQHNPPG